MPPQSTLDIQASRARASFDPDALHRVLLNGSKDPAMRRRITEILEQNPSFDKGASPYQSRAQQIERGLHLAKALFEVVDKHDLDYIEYLEALFASDTPMGLNLHEIAFTPVIQSQGSDEQQEEWLPRCYNHEILGCYLQVRARTPSNASECLLTRWRRRSSGTARMSSVSQFHCLLTSGDCY